MVQLCLYIFALFTSYSYSFEYLGTLVGNPDVKTKIDYDGSFSSSAHSDFINGSLDQSRHELSLYVPVYQEGGEAFGLSTDVQSMRLSGYDFAADTRIHMSNDFQGYEFGAFYRKKLEDNKTIAFSATINSLSDKPYANANDNSVEVFGVYKIQKTATTDLVFVLNYTNHRTILSGIPIPGFAYVINPKPELFAVLGLPASYVLAIPFTDFIVTGTAIIPLVFKFDLNYRFYGPLMAFVGWEMDQRYYFVSERTNEKERVYFSENGYTVGLKMLFSRTSYITLGANFDYKNSIFAAESYYGDRSWAIDVNPHWNLDFKGTFTF